MTTQTARANKVRKPAAKSAVHYNFVEHDHKGPHLHCSNAGMFGGPTFLLGDEKNTFNFGSVDALVGNCMAIAESDAFTLPQVRVTDNGSWEINYSVLKVFDDRMHAPTQMKRFIKPKTPTKKVSAIRLMANDWMGVMVDGLFIEPVHQFFERDREILVNRRNELAPEYRDIADNRAALLDKAQGQVVAALPMLMTKLSARYPDASTAQLFQGALQLIGQQLSPVLSFIQLWSTGLRQSLDPALKSTLRIIRAIITSNLFLALTGNLRLDKWRNKEDIKQKINTIKVSVRDVVLPVLIGAFDSGPAVIPMTGEAGIMGGHIAFFPWNLVKLLPAMIPIYAHETGHVIQRIIIKYLETYAQLTVDTITKALDGGLKLDEEFIDIGGQKIPARVIWPKVLVNELTEDDADHLACRAAGPAALIQSFAIYIGAMNGTAKGDIDKVDHFFRSSSTWSPKATKVPGQVDISTEPHAVDIVRVGRLQARMALNLGFPEVSDFARKTADEEGGDPAPTHITYVGVMPKGDGQDDDSLAKTDSTGKKTRKAPAKKRTGKAKTDEAPEGGDSTDSPQPKPKQPKLPSFQLSIADYDKLIDLVVKAWLDTPTDCLNGMTLRELVNMTPEMHEKIDDVRARLRAGNGKPSEDYHTWHLTVGSAFVEEYFAQVDAGGKPEEVRARLMKPAMEMLDQITEWWEEEVVRLDIYNLKSADVQPKEVFTTKVEKTEATEPKAKAKAKSPKAKTTKAKTTKKS